MNKDYVIASEIQYIYCECCWIDDLEGKSISTQAMATGTQEHERSNVWYRAMIMVKRLAILMYSLENSYPNPYNAAMPKRSESEPERSPYMDLQDRIEQVRREDMARKVGEKSVQTTPEELPAITDETLFSEYKLRQLEDMYSDEGLAAVRRKLAIEPHFTPNDDFDLSAIYGTDPVVNTLIQSHINEMLSNHKDPIYHIRHAVGDVFNQIAYDLYAIREAQEDEVVFGKEATQKLYGSVLDRAVQPTKKFQELPTFLAPYMSYVRDGKVSSVIETTTSASYSIFDHKVKKFDESKDLFVQRDVLQDARLTLLVPNNAAFTLVRMDTEWGERQDIDVIMLPIRKEAVHDFVKAKLA